jgi:hypothetical protein
MRGERETLTTTEEICWKEVSRFAASSASMEVSHFLLFLLCFATCPFFFCLNIHAGSAFFFLSHVTIVTAPRSLRLLSHEFQSSELLCLFPISKIDVL